MRYLIRKVTAVLFVFTVLWGLCLSKYEITRNGIPENVRIYELDAAEVLAGGAEKIDAKRLHLDFDGTVSLEQKSRGCYAAICRLFGVIRLKSIELQVIAPTSVIPGGIPVGIYVETNGVFVIGTGQLEAENGEVANPAEHVVKTGDYITSFDGREIHHKQELLDAMEDYESGEIILGIRRNQEDIQVSLMPAKTRTGYRMGIWVRDDTQGIGTLTFLTPDGNFGALGHGISDTDSSLLMEVSGGKLYETQILKIVRGEKGNPGELTGSINYDEKYLYGTIQKNTEGGIYGKAAAHLKNQLNDSVCTIALRQEIREGPAVIRSAVDGSLREYEIVITALHTGNGNVNKGIEFRVTDETLLSLTGGIVQGMSGSPILQDGRMVGAVTHVFVSDPTKGYGIFAEMMLE